MFSAFSPQVHALYTPHTSSPLSSSPLRNSPSPLSPRDANLLARNPDEMMTSPTPSPSKAPRPAVSKSSSSVNTSTSTGANWSDALNTHKPAHTSTLPSPPPSQGRESVFSKRVTKSNPLINRTADEGREARRKLFLKKVKEGSEDRRWRERNGGLGEGEEEVLRAIWVQEERRREEERKREARGVFAVVEEEEEMLLDAVMADEVAMKEEAELEALLSQEEMEALLWDEQAQPQIQKSMETPYGSDDEEYDHIFMDVIEEENRIASQQQQQPPEYLDADSEMMDMS